METLHLFLPLLSGPLLVSVYPLAKKPVNLIEVWQEVFTRLYECFFRLMHVHFLVRHFLGSSRTRREHVRKAANVASCKLAGNLPALPLN